MRLRTDSAFAVAMAAASITTILTQAAFAGETPGAVTVSLSGSTAMRGFTTSPDFSGLTPGATINVNGVTYVMAPTDAANGVFPIGQLAASLGTGTPTPPNPITGTYNAAAYRIEWHEQGSVEGIAEMANDQIGYFGSTPLVASATRNPTSLNPVWVQRASQTNTTGLIGTSNYNTYSTANYNAAGANLQGGQNRVQMAISDVRAAQGFSVAGTPSPTRMAGEAGYGKGNPALIGSSNLLGLGTANARRQLVAQSALNMETTKIDPQTGATYAAGPWNTAGVANTVSTRVAATATTFAANPGTGLTDVNKTDAQWLQATGRLANGADFNVVTRDINSGTLNVASQNIGLDPSFAVDENDSGNGNLNNAAESRVDLAMRFSGKTAGGGQLRPTVQASRMAIGHLSLSDVRGSSFNTAANPVRALGFRNSADNSAAAVQASIGTIHDGTYALFQYETYVTVKNVNSPAATAAGSAAAYAALTDAQTGIKGDNSGNDVRDFRDNILNSATQFPTNNTFVNPGNGLLAQGFLPTRLLSVTKPGDGLAVTANPAYDAQAASDYAAVAASSYANNFAVGAAAAVTSGGSASLYGQASAADANAATANIALTTNNYLFGDFDGDGKRDFKDIKYAQQASATLNASGLTTNWLTPGTAATASASNNTANVYATLSKGDLIVKGDFDSDGTFDGRDLYGIARGTALADAGKTAAQLANPDNAQLTTASGATVSDRYRGGVLYKNAALDYLQANATTAQKASASANAANDPTGVNAFNKFDVNRDGRVNRDDAGIVDGFVGRDYRNLADQLSAVVATNTNAAGTRFVGDPTLDPTTARKSISLVDVELNDTGTITHVAPIGGTSDFKLIRVALGTQLLDGDADFDGGVSINDFNALAANFGVAGGQKWSSGDFDFDGGVSINDFNLLAGGFGQTAPASSQWAALLAFAAAHDDLAAFESVTGVPEPTGLAVLAVAATLGLRRRR